MHGAFGTLACCGESADRRGWGVIAEYTEETPPRIVGGGWGRRRCQDRTGASGPLTPPVALGPPRDPSPRGAGDRHHRRDRRRSGAVPPAGGHQPVCRAGQARDTKVTEIYRGIPPPQFAPPVLTF